MTLNAKRSKVPHITCYNYPNLPYFTLFCSTASRFWVPGHLRQVHRMTPNNSQPEKVKGTPYTFHNYPRCPNFTQFRSTASPLRVTGHFETNVPNDPKMTFNAKGSKVCHIHFTTTPSPKFNSFSLKYIRRFQDICHLSFSHWPQCLNFNLFSKMWNFKMRVSKICEDCHREHSEKKVAWTEKKTTLRGVAFWKFLISHNVRFHSFSNNLKFENA